MLSSLSYHWCMQLAIIAIQVAMFNKTQKVLINATLSDFLLSLNAL